jgi:hypothetical protein
MLTALNIPIQEHTPTSSQKAEIIKKLHLPHAANHAGCKEPIMNLTALPFHTVQTQVPYLDGFFFST